MIDFKNPGKESTSCKDCVFAIRRDGVQTGCNLYRLDKLADNGAEILKNGKSFFVFGRICTACRNTDWGRKHKKKDWKTLVFDYIQVRMDVIIHVSETDTLDSAKKTIDSACNQIIKPTMIVIACENKDITAELIDDLRNRNIRWKLENSNAYDAADLCEGSYYCIFMSGYEIPKDYIFNVNKAINHDLKRFVLVLPDENGNGMIVQHIRKSAKERFSAEELIEIGKNTLTSRMILTHGEI